MGEFKYLLVFAWCVNVLCFLSFIVCLLGLSEKRCFNLGWFLAFLAKLMVNDFLLISNCSMQTSLSLLLKCSLWQCLSVKFYLFYPWNFFYTSATQFYWNDAFFLNHVCSTKMSVHISRLRYKNRDLLREGFNKKARLFIHILWISVLPHPPPYPHWRIL